MPFNPNIPVAHTPNDAEEIRNNFNALHDQLTPLTAALDCSNGAPVLPDVLTIANPVAGNLAFDYEALRLTIYTGSQWNLV